MKFIAVSSIALLFIGQAFAKPAEGCLKNYTITAVDSCVSVAAQFQITEAEFYAMNPGLHHSAAHDCDNLDTGKPFCVCMKEPCSGGVAVAGNSTSNATLPSTALVSATASASGSASASPVSLSASATPSLVHTNTTSASSGGSSSSAVPSSSQSAKAASSASTTTIFTVAAFGMTLAASSLLL
ncbi:GTPase required for pre-60S ribosomal subunit nuclear export and maturation [Mucor velutinosus]|uniref:GTPase required for pre-60S ribosomal subunit nuclear export and maturation n=1 Tax=Mucor velutinosus TaxID=708070 RepID=A0AAN7DJD6_9FUNG|nr:GTPase required for pre-60S ribosomal subunit nuclear export and maturation [Mucor velutinosus]